MDSRVNLINLERANGQIKSTGTWWVLISKCNGYLEETELRKADRMVGVNCNIFMFRSSAPIQVTLCPIDSQNGLVAMVTMCLNLPTLTKDLFQGIVTCSPEED